MNKHQKGFTLIELLIVIGVIAVLIGVFVTTVNLSRPFAQARNAQRYANVSQLASAIKGRMADNRGVWSPTNGCPDLPTAAPLVIASNSDALASMSTAGLVNLGCLVPRYLGSFPVDPSTGREYDVSNVDTGYTVQIVNGRIEVTAPSGEDVDTTIKIVN